MISREKPYVYCLSAGEYSDYQEDWYVHERKMNESQIQDLLRVHVDEAKKIAAARDNEKWDECEKLFGERKWPYHGGMRSPKGTEKQFRSWQDKFTSPRWGGLTLMSVAEIVWNLAGFEPLEPDFRKHCENSHYIPDQMEKWAGVYGDGSDA